MWRYSPRNLFQISGETLKQTITLGAYGWRHAHWAGTFYPDELPVAEEDWRLSYYSNEFNTVLVPADYWLNGRVNDCEDWLDSVHTEFQFFVECRASMLDVISLADLTGALTKLNPQLSALVLTNDNALLSDAVKKQFFELAALLNIEVFDVESGSTHFVFIEDELLDLRAAKTKIEQLIAQINGVETKESRVNIIVNHPQLQAENLTKFRTVLDIMGY